MAPASAAPVPLGAVARHRFGPDGPGDAPSYERPSENDPESLGDAPSLARHWNTLGSWAGSQVRLRDRIPRGRRLARLAIGFVALVVLGTTGGAGLLYANADLNRTNPDFLSNNTALYYGDGHTELTTLSVQNRTTIPYAQMPQSIKDAAVAAENRSYWQDQGVSLAGMARAGVAIVTGKQVQGGSTITQQYAKLVYLSSDRTVIRKVREIAYALKLSDQRSKEVVLEDYLNTVFFGRDAYGVQAAARAWFGKDAKNLNVGESAVLAAVIQNSSILDPAVSPDNKARLEGRYEYVLSGMLAMGSITQQQYDRFHGHLPAMPGQPLMQRYDGPQGFLVNMVEAELKRLGYDEAEINGGGLRVTTTFDPAAQKAAEKAATEQRDRAAAAATKGAPRADLHAAIASVDSHTGAVLALYGGDDFVKNSRNWATTPRMTGSTFKAFGLVAALRDGNTLNSTFNGNTFQLDRQPMPVRNEFNRNYGSAVSLQYATQESINTAFVDMVHQMQDGPKKVMKAANDAGAPTGMGWGNYDRMVLGEPEVSPLDMAASYATLTNGGVRHAPHVVAEVKDMHGKVLYKADDRGEQAIEADIARDTTYALQRVTQSGTGTRAAALGRPVAGKTGTAGAADSIYASWFIGATTRVSTAVMYVAGNDGQTDLDPYAQPGARTFFGSGYPAQTWLDYMQVATKGDPWEAFPPAAQVSRPRLRG
ncbi:Membrane carboxypeptidase (penicillin-binding protein) [Raineyella antarctica]|uniref:Membrane carboxypeptidase (Penicillin-binding protein) n=1 Tax=Raineyella antarctica TaxID=1577474 RepID=A0A1G6H6F7_9ACTN|nr:transglycosylase domain-containing protein [Raineyella antarctica]SDB89811.1 Membrane carboxypeptidase (penicillin-binding protein) [Raineyella antarctica]